MKKPDEFKDKSGGEDQGGSSGRGTAGKVEFRIATLAGDSRNEPRTPAERRQFAILHEASQTDRIRRSKERKKALAARQEQGPVSLNQRQAYTAGGGGGRAPSNFKQHPLSQTAYFSGAEESPLPAANDNADLNQEDRKELENRAENRLQHRLALQQAPVYNSTPTLKRH